MLEYLGHQTRYVNFHNIPQQGNHSAVEVLIDSKWGFLDPTFGAYFTKNGFATGDLLSLNEIFLHGVSSKNVFRVVDRDLIKVDYKKILDLFLDIKKMGETNAIIGRSKNLTPKSLIHEVEKHYLKNFSCIRQEDYAQSISATFEVIYLYGTK